MNDDILLTREQIGLALEYSDPMVAMKKFTKDIKIDLIIFHLPFW